MFEVDSYQSRRFHFHRFTCLNCDTEASSPSRCSAPLQLHWFSGIPRFNAIRLGWDCCRDTSRLALIAIGIANMRGIVSKHHGEINQNTQSEWDFVPSKLECFESIFLKILSQDESYFSGQTLIWFKPAVIHTWLDGDSRVVTPLWACLPIMYEQGDSIYRQYRLQGSQPFL